MPLCVRVLGVASWCCGAGGRGGFWSGRAAQQPRSRGVAPHNVIAVVQWFIVSGGDGEILVGGLVRSCEAGPLR
jgi:hypothetical protein